MMLRYWPIYRERNRMSFVLETMRAGEKLCKSLRLKASGETEITYIFEPSGRKCGQRAAESAIKSGQLRPESDGLFEPEFSQTWTLA